MSLSFQTGEQVLCFHGPLLYEAKILKAEYWKDKEDHEDGAYYFVHYKGWKQTWDEWVPEERILKFSEENLKKQNELKESLKTKKSKDTKRQHENDTKEKGRKRPRESTVERDEDSSRKPDVHITIPEKLKNQLVEDWENVTKNQKLVRLPRNPTVADILKRYQESVSGKKGKKAVKESSTEGTVEEVCRGIQLYFDRSLGNLLLYRFERQQYVDVKKESKDKEMSEIYGAEHLLRLFVQFPSLITHTTMEQDAVNVLTQFFSDILRYMQENYSELFLAEYDNVNPAYIAQMKATG